MEIKSKQDLISAIYEIWDHFSQDAIDRLVLSFQARLYAVIDRNGQSITDLLRSGIDHIISTVIPFRPNLWTLQEIIEVYDPTEDPNDFEILTKRPFSVDEDILLLQKVKELGNKWTLISKLFVGRTPTSLRTRHAKLRKNI